MGCAPSSRGPPPLDRLTTFLHMGGYASFVWPALAVTAAILIGLLWVSLRQTSMAETHLAEMEAMHPRRGDQISSDGHEA